MSFIDQSDSSMTIDSINPFQIRGLISAGGEATLLDHLLWIIRFPEPWPHKHEVTSITIDTGQLITIGYIAQRQICVNQALDVF